MKLPSASTPTSRKISSDSIGPHLRFMAVEAATEHTKVGRDAESLRRILDDYQDGADAVEGEGIGAELIRIIRQISLARNRAAAIELELSALLKSEIALLKRQADESEQDGRDLLTELANSVREQIELARKGTSPG